MKERGEKSRDRKRKGKIRNAEEGQFKKKKKKAWNQVVYFASLVFVIDYPRLVGRDQSNCTKLIRSSFDFVFVCLTT